MIVFFSFDGDEMTNQIIDWLIYYRCNFIRVNLNNEDYKNINVVFQKTKISLTLKLKNEDIIDFDNVDFFFIRGLGFEFEKSNDTILPFQLYNHYIQKEYNSLINLFYKEANKKSIGCFYTDHDFDKLTQLKIALECELKIPKSIITSSKSQIEKTYSSKPIITKAIYDNVATEYDEKLYVQRVQRIDISSTENVFFPSFIQSEIEKKYEIRSFYLDGKFYSISIFSSALNVDSRDNYTESYYAAYRLPEDIETKLKKMMQKLQLISGSIDLIKSTDDNYYFLEVNPTGQYDWVSVYGNYDLHRIIAEFLIDKTKKNEN
jgi:hypothetical protein